MILHVGERVFWGTPEIIYLEGTIMRLEEATQAAVVRIDRAGARSAHLIGTEVAFYADGLAPLQGESPAGTTSQASTETQQEQPLSDEEKIRSAAAALVHQRYGYTLAEEQEKAITDQVVEAIEQDGALRARIIASIDDILKRGVA